MRARDWFGCCAFRAGVHTVRGRMYAPLSCRPGLWRARSVLDGEPTPSSGRFFDAAFDELARRIFVASALDANLPSRAVCQVSDCDFFIK